MVLFENGMYNATLVSPALADLEVSGIRVELATALKRKTGMPIIYKRDDATLIDDSAFEILLGNTNRPQSAYPEGADEETDAYYCVEIKGNKLVINGSDVYELKRAVDCFIYKYL